MRPSAPLPTAAFSVGLDTLLDGASETSPSPQWLDDPVLQAQRVRRMGHNQRLFLQIFVQADEPLSFSAAMTRAVMIYDFNMKGGDGYHRAWAAVSKLLEYDWLCDSGQRVGKREEVAYAPTARGRRALSAGSKVVLSRFYAAMMEALPSTLPVLRSRLAEDAEFAEMRLDVEIIEALKELGRLRWVAKQANSYQLTRAGADALARAKIS